MAYDAKGRCILRRDGLGNVEEKQYDYMGNLRYVTPPNLEGTEKAWSYRYNYFNYLLEKQDPLGNRVLYERDLYGHITSETSLGYGETQEDAPRTQYIYDKEGNRTHIRYPDGSVERFWYDKKNHIIKHVTPEYYQEETDDGVGTCYEYDQGGRLTATYQEDGSLTNRYGYHPSGRLLWEEDGAGNRITYTYDLAGNLIQKREPIGLKEEYRVTLWEYDACGNQILEKQGKEAVSLDEMPRSWHTIWFAYDALNRLILVKDNYGAKVSYRYDCLNQKTYESYRISKDVKKVVRYYYDAAGNLIKKEEELASPYRKQPGVMPPNKAVTTYTYDKNKNLIQQIEPSGATKEWHYDVADRLVEERIVEEGSGIDRRYGYTYDPQGRIVKAVDYSLEEFAEKAYVYDAKGRLTHYQNEEGGILRLFYDKNNRIQKAVLPKLFEEKAEEGAGPSYSYNLSGDVTEIRDAYGTVKERYGYDQSGRRIHITNGAGDREEAEYDKAGNLIKLTRGTGKETSHQKMHYSVQGYLTGVADGNGNETHFVTDDWGRITEIHTPDGGVEKYTYDYGGNLISSKDTYGNALEYTYNSQGRVCEIQDQDGLLQQYVYDEEGRPLLHVDRNGNQIHTTYNMDQQLLYRQAYEKGQNKVLTERYRYDAKGLLKESIGGGITYHYHHSKAGRLLEKRSGKKLLLSYEYDKNGNCIEETDQKGETLTYQYDDANQLREIHQKETNTRLVSYAYDKAGRIKQTICGNGMETRYEYDSRGMLKDLQTSTPSDSQSLYHCHYTYDGNGNRTKREGQGVETTYGYDSRNRLTQWEMEGYKGVSYEYDFNGNRIYKKEEEQETFYTYNRKNQLVSLQNNEKVLQFLYDNQGNLLGQESASQGNANQSENRHYTYDALNRQTSITTGEGKIQRNLYDAEGMRYQKEEESGNENKVIQLVYDRNKNLVSSSVNEKYLRVVGGSFPEALLQKGKQETTISYYGKDEQGSILHLTDEDGRVKNQYQYDAFGAILESKEEVDNPLTYTGQEYDEIPSQYYLRARYYNPLLGRFLQEDSYHGDGLNLYAYCQNNPVMYYDPSGYKRSDCKQDTSGRVDEGAEVSGGNTLSNGNVQHIKKHSFEGMAEQANYLDDVKLQAKLDNTSFFTKEWSMDEVSKYTQQAIDSLAKKGITNGTHNVVINNESITVVLENGIFKTAFGNYKYTIDDFK